MTAEALGTFLLCYTVLSLTDPDRELVSRAELARRVSGALHGAPITIADDALTRDSTLIVERTRPRTPDGVPFGYPPPLTPGAPRPRS